MIKRPDLLIIAAGAALSAVAIACPPWRAVAISSESHRPEYTAEDFRHLRAGLSFDTGWTRVDTLHWGLAFHSIFNPPTMEDHFLNDQFTPAILAVAKDSILTDSARNMLLDSLVAAQHKAREARFNALRIPFALRMPSNSSDTIGERAYSVWRTDRFTFAIDATRLAITVLFVSVTTVAAYFLIAASRNSS